MANTKKNINELVANDDHPAELDEVTFRRDHLSPPDGLLESEEQTCDLHENRSSDAQTISKLQYDIEQLRAKWLGLETEIAAREEISHKLNSDIAGLRESVSRKEKLLKTRERKIKSLKAEIRNQDEHHKTVTAELKGEIEVTRKGAEYTLASEEDRLARSEAYADSLRHKFQDLLAHQDDLIKERDRVSGALSEVTEKNQSLEDALASAADDKLQLGEKLESIDEAHAEELRVLRFELGEAQETITESETLNSQLASDLVDSRSFKEDLERVLSEKDEEAGKRIAELEKELARVSRTTDDIERKLDDRGDTINVLLTELARKSEQMESINQIGDVISEIDVRISEQFDGEKEQSLPVQKSADRVSRVLIGKVGKQLLRFPLFKDRLTIGRTADNDIQINAAYISRRHAVLQTDDDTTRVIDWGSKNGVYVNSAQVTEHFLKNGDIVTIGNAHFRYEERPKRDA